MIFTRGLVTALTLGTLVIPRAGACPVGGAEVSASERKQIQQARFGPSKRPARKPNEAVIPQLPEADSAAPWGGVLREKRDRWQPEAILANAVSRALNQAWRDPKVNDVLVSVPVRMVPTSRRVYGDGQTNSTLTFNSSWSAREPQLVATLMAFEGGTREVRFLFSSELKLPAPTVVLHYRLAAKDERAEIKLKKSPRGLEGTWSVPSNLRFGDLETSRVVWVQPEGWQQAFPIDFRAPVVLDSELREEAAGAKTFGQSPLDPAGVRERSKKANVIAQDTLKSGDYGHEWFRDDKGQVMLINTSIHGDVEVNGSLVKTAVGGGLTWFVDHGPHSTFKNLYTCFDARDVKKETEARVPSGGGWHEIGDAAETIINNLEDDLILVGFATGKPEKNPPMKMGFVDGLTDVATITYLRPHDAIITPAGPTTWDEDQIYRDARKRGKFDNGPRGQDPERSEGRNYHWFLFDGDQPVCTQEWVHNCAPKFKNHLGLRCP